MTSGYAQINVQGPRSRELLQSLTTADLSNEAFPFRTAREIDIGYARVLCVRITYLGELGYELYIPAEQATHVYDRIVEAGEGRGAAARGAQGAREPAHGEGLPRLRARHRQHRLGARGGARLRGGPEEAGRLPRASEAVLAKKAAGPLTRRLVQVLVKDPEPMMFHAEVVRRDGKPVGYVRAGVVRVHASAARSGSRWWRRGEPVDQAYLDAGRWEVEIAGKTYPAMASLKPLYDPESKKIKA